MEKTKKTESNAVQNPLKTKQILVFSLTVALFTFALILVGIVSSYYFRTDYGSRDWYVGLLMLILAIGCLVGGVYLFRKSSAHYLGNRQSDRVINNLSSLDQPSTGPIVLEAADSLIEAIVMILSTMPLYRRYTNPTQTFMLDPGFVPAGDQGEHIPEIHVRRMDAPTSEVLVLRETANGQFACLNPEDNVILQEWDKFWK